MSKNNKKNSEDKKVDEEIDKDIKIDSVEDDTESEKDSTSEETQSNSESEEKLKKEYENLNDQYMRLRAEYDNFRKRSLGEKSSIYSNAVADTVMEFLSVADNIDRAAQQKYTSVDNINKGMEMLSSQMTAVLEKLGVTQTGKVGEKFDPNIHNAVAHVEDDNFEENVISEVLQKGYMLGDKVVRHAMVQVAN